MTLLAVEHFGQPLLLHPSGAILLAESKTLLVADLHLGKETVFQKAGIAIPHGPTANTLDRLSELASAHSIERVLVLGDLLHAKIGLTPSLELAMRDLFSNHPQVNWTLVAGNHDRGATGALRSLGWDVLTPPVDEACWQWVHDPAEASAAVDAGSQSHAQSLDRRLTMAGHIHPSVRLRLSRNESVRLRCFWLRPNMVVLPAFGGWTGTHAIEAATDDRIIACIDGALMELSPQLLRSSDRP
jgi:uncharacterized protein